MTHNSFRLPVAVTALLALVAALLVVLGGSTASAETPAERCSRETSAYNDAWEASWRLANPGGGTPPPPPAPYICRDPSLSPEPTTPAPEPAPGLPLSTTEAPAPARDRVGSNAPTNFPEYNGTDIVPVPRFPGAVPPRIPEVPRGSAIEAVPAQPPVGSEQSLTIDDILAACKPDAIPRPVQRSNLTPRQEASYELLRDTGSRQYQEGRQKINFDIRNGVYGDKYSPGSWDADHVISLTRLVQVPGFTDLSPEDQLSIAHSPENLKPLRVGWNRSKQDKSVYNWEGPRSGPSPTPTEAERVELCESERVATDYILDQISLRRPPPAREQANEEDVAAAPTAAPTAPPSLTDTPTQTAEEIPYQEEVVPATPEWTATNTVVEPEPAPAWTEPSVVPVEPTPTAVPSPAPSTSQPPVEIPRITGPTIPTSSPPTRPSTNTQTEDEDEDDRSFWEKAKPWAVGAGVVVGGAVAVATVGPAVGAAVVGAAAIGAATG